MIKKEGKGKAVGFREIIIETKYDELMRLLASGTKEINDVHKG